MVKEFAAGQAVAAVTHLSGNIADLAFNVGKEHFKSKIDDNKLHMNLKSHIEHHRKYNDVCSLAEEIDFQGLVEYIDEYLLDDVSVRVFSPNKKERERARQNIINKAIAFSTADTDIARSRVIRFISTALDIIKDFYSKKVSCEDWIVATEIADAVTEEIGAKIDELNKNSKFSLEAYDSMGKQGDFSGINNNLKSIAGIASCNHPLYPDYGFEINGNVLKSLPLTTDAMKKYPPRIICRGVAKMDNTILNRIDADIIDYADRHQLQIIMRITEAKKLLGTTDDPDQTEARNMVGQLAIRPPKEFPPAFPCNIKMNEEIIYEYVELRTAEILDDETYVINNREQKNCHLRIEIRFNLTDPRKKIHYTVETENATNQDMLIFTKMMKKAAQGSNMAVYALNMGENLIAGPTDPFEYETDFESIDDEIDFLQRICDIENYTGQIIVVPDQFTEEEVLQVKYVSELIRGNENEFEWRELSLNLTVDAEFREIIAETDDEYHSLTFAGESVVNLFDNEFELSTLRKIRCAKIKDLDRFRKKLEYTDDGEKIQISFIAGDDNTFYDCLAKENESKRLDE